MYSITQTVALILEVSSSFYPEKNGIFAPNSNFITPPQQTWVQFGGNQNVLCGPSPYLNTLNCFGTKYKNFTQSVPIPGDLSTTPVFVQNSWILGTTKGFLFRLKAQSEKNTLPTIDPQSTEFWGSESRAMMENFVPKTLYKEEDGEIKPHTQNDATTHKKQVSSAYTLKSYLWVFPTSSPFVGTPIVKNNLVYALTANQYLQALDFESGKLVWSVKLGADVSFYLANHSLRVTENFVLISTTRGELLILDPLSGNQIKHITIGTQSDQENQFPNIVAAPLLIGETDAILSNAISTTKKISLNSLDTLWSYPAGSINTPLLINSNTVILTTTTGKVVSIQEQSGVVNWTTDLNMNSPLVDTTIMHDNKTLLVATQRGEMVAIDVETGKKLVQNRPIGSVVGSFFRLSNHPQESCLSFSTGSFRCFKVKR